MNPEAQRIKKELIKETSQEKKWFKLLDETHLHPREEVISDWINFPEKFDTEEQESMEKHFQACKECAQKRDNTSPLFQDLEKAS